MIDNSNKNVRITLSRNTPVALVVGAAGFFGSHLVDKLLQKGLQVIGVDGLTYGKRENLSKASEDKNFHLYIDSLDNLDIEFPRLDYLFVVPEKDTKIGKILSIFKKIKPRLLLVSKVSLYDKAIDDFKWLKGIESEIAREAKENNLNARILRLGSIFGPRMDFEGEDPLIRLIQKSLLGDLQKETSLDFSSRALFVDDAVDLAVKCIFAGATAQKIFDGVLPTPIKVSEIKQVLLDPVWYESKQFMPTELPPWPTPNLEKTQKLLNWHTSAKLVSHLKYTLAYFKDNEIKVPPAVEGKDAGVEDSWKKEKAQQLAGLKQENEKVKGGSMQTKLSPLTSRLLYSMAVLFIVYALLWPVLQTGFGILTFKSQLFLAINSLQKGQFEDSLFAVKRASDGVLQVKSIFYSLEPIRKTGILKKQFEIGDSLLNLAALSADASYEAILGVGSLDQSVRFVTGELNESSQRSFEKAAVYLSSADEKIAKAQALLGNPDFKPSLPYLIKKEVEQVSERLTLYSNLVKKARVLSVLLPEVVAMDGSKSYLILLQNNEELRPTGGSIASFAKVSFEGGKLKKSEVNDILVLDKQLKIKTDLGQKDYFLKDSNWEPDFPTSAREAEWFYTKETGERLDGVVALDTSAIADMLSVVGPLDLADINEKVDSTNLFEKAISHSQAKKSFLTALTSALFNKLFFLPGQNWLGISDSLSKSLAEKHMSIYLDNPILFSYVVSQKWASSLPRGDTGIISADFLALVEANLGANQANYYLDRKLNLETMIGNMGEVSHRLRIAYTNRSPSDVFPAGKYKNRMRVYLPAGTKLTRIFWGESDIIKDVSGFVDYGRTGYSFLLELLPKEQKTLVLEYQTPLKLEYKEGKAQYKLNVIKQAGTLKDPFEWRVTYPINVKLSSNQNQKIGPQEYLVQTDLSTDKTFELEFSH